MTNDFDIYFPSLKSKFVRSIFVLLACAAVCMGAEFGGGGNSRSLAGSKPNLVLIIADDRPATRFRPKTDARPTGTTASQERGVSRARTLAPTGTSPPANPPEQQQ